MLREPIKPEYSAVLEEYGMRDCAEAYLLHFRRGEHLYMEGQPLEYLMLVLEGCAKVVVGCENGRTLLLAFYKGRGLLGEVELMTHRREAVTTVQAISDMCLIGMPVYYQDALLENAAFLRCAGEALARKLDRVCNNSAFNLLYPLEARLAGYILLSRDGDWFGENLTHLAELLGTSYRHLLRTIHALCDQGILQKERSGYRIMDMERLQACGKTDMWM